MTRYTVFDDIPIDKAQELGIVCKNPNKTKIQLSYCLVPRDIKGWVDAEKFVPSPYDLCHLRTNGEKRCAGWWTGWMWFGYKLRESEIVVAWRKDEEDV